MNLPNRIDDEQMQRITAAFLEENAVTNLSAIRDFDTAWEKHIVDSLQAVPIIAGRIGNGAEILDIGTGGGFPLLPLAAAFPEHRFFGLDSVAKKLAAIQRIAVKAGVKNITQLTGRAEELGRNKEYRQRFAVVTARAVAKFPVMLELASPFVKNGSLLLAYRGPETDPDDVPLAAKLRLDLLEKREYELAGGEQRSIWVFVKNGDLAKRFPRATGIPKKKPLTLADFTA